MLAHPLQSLSSQFFRNGQVIETFRGHGIHQEALDVAVEKLNSGDWVRRYRPSCLEASPS